MSRNPGSIIEETIRTRMLRDHFSGVRYEVLLDLGCGTRPYMELYDPVCGKTIGADMPGSYFDKTDVDIECTVYEIPLADGSVDAVLLAEVLHDITEPSDMLREVRRILKPGGTLIMTSPFMVPICDDTYDHYRYTRHGIGYILRKNGFQADAIRPVSGLAGSSIQLVIRPILKFWNKLAKVTRLSFLYSALNPFMLLLVYGPQWIYLFFHGLAGKGLPGGIRKKMEYGCIGYVTIAHKT